MRNLTKILVLALFPALAVLNAARPRRPQARRPCPCPPPPAAMPR